MGVTEAAFVHTVRCTIEIVAKCVRMPGGLGGRAYGSNSTPTFWLSSRAEPGNQHRRIFDAVARTASSLKRDRRFADSPLEGSGFEPSVPRKTHCGSTLLSCPFCHDSRSAKGTHPSATGD